MAFDATIADQLTAGVLSAFHTGIANSNTVNTSLVQAMGVAALNITQIGALAGAAMLLRVSDPGQFAGLNTAAGIPGTGGAGKP